MDTSIKLQPPKWDSNKRDEWHTFSTDFESFVEYAGGENLITQLKSGQQHSSLVPSKLAQSYANSSSEESSKPAAAEDHQDEFLAQAALSDKDYALDKRLYHVLKLSITGSAHD